ncbi:HNH endonuclease signature motif containing protein [Massilia sp. UBA6681]|uniref:HNH endonuclease signature motif containing protein n=1 Tax=Massilia sp. UBA6681 TaxID=1946839 RepID=UPI0025BE456C
MDVIGGLRSGQRFLASALTRDLGSLSPEQLAAEAAAVQSLRRQADALNLALLAAADAKNAHRTTGDADMTALVANGAGITRREATKQIKLATRIETAPQVKKALAKPGMSTAKAAIVTGALDDLPSDLTAAQRDQVEFELVEAAQEMTADQLTRKAKRAIETLDVKRADDIENKRLQREEHAQRQLSEFWVGRPDEQTGLVKFGGKTDALTADMLRAVIESKTSPRKRALAEAEKTGVDVTPVEDRRDLTPAEKAGEAFAEIIRHLPTESFGNHGGVNAALVVTIDEQALRGQTDRAGVTEFGTSISAGELRMIACNAGILPAVLDGSSVPLDVGRTKRFHTQKQRIALAQRDQGCAYPGCDRPPGWCESHHATRWTDGGHTNIDNGVLLCGHHHRHVHQTDIPIRFVDRHPEFQIRGTWQHNHRYRPRQRELITA